MSRRVCRVEVALAGHVNCVIRKLENLTQYSHSTKKFKHSIKALNAVQLSLEIRSMFKCSLEGEAGTATWWIVKLDWTLAWCRPRIHSWSDSLPESLDGSATAKLWLHEVLWLLMMLLLLFRWWTVHGRNIASSRVLRDIVGAMLWLIASVLLLLLLLSVTLVHITTCECWWVLVALAHVVLSIHWVTLPNLVGRAQLWLWIANSHAKTSSRLFGDWLVISTENVDAALPSWRCMYPSRRPVTLAEVMLVPLLSSWLFIVLRCELLLLLVASIVASDSLLLVRRLELIAGRLSVWVLLIGWLLIWMLLGLVLLLILLLRLRWLLVLRLCTISSANTPRTGTSYNWMKGEMKVMNIEHRT